MHLVLYVVPIYSFSVCTLTTLHLSLISKKKKLEISLHYRDHVSILYQLQRLIDKWIIIDVYLFIKKRDCYALLPDNIPRIRLSVFVFIVWKNIRKDYNVITVLAALIVIVIHI